jgi:phenylacetate-CoA ligase
VEVYGRFFRSVLLPTWETRIRRRPTLARLAFLERTQWRSHDELHALQSGALRRLIHHAYEHVPFYRRRFDAAGLSPHDIRTPEDLAKLPVLTREDARQDPESRASTSPPFATIRKNTGGTTGQPLLFGYEPDSEHWRNAIRLRGYRWAGYELGDKVLHYWGAPVEDQPPFTTRAKIAADRWMKRETYVACAVMGEREMRAVVERIEREQPRVIVCYTQAGAELARFINANGLRSWDTIRVICGAERLFPSDRADLEEAFGGHIFETYGCREVMLIGAECELHEGLHVSMENLVVEIVVTEPDGTRRPAREGEIGEVMITDLHNLGMPFIRYLNGDMAVAGGAGRCGCGRTLPRIASVEGRSADLIRDANGAAVSGIAFNVLFTGLAGAARQWQVVQHKDRSVTLRVVPGESLDGGKLDAMRRMLGRYVQGLPVSVETVASIEPTKAGKRRTVIVEA